MDSKRELSLSLLTGVGRGSLSPLHTTLGERYHKEELATGTWSSSLLLKAGKEYK